jgi:hypothetical protein
MEDVLDLYAESPDAKRPVVCFDESPTQLRTPAMPTTSFGIMPPTPEGSERQRRKRGVNSQIYLTVSS